ncbi:MAG: SusC/RagA family TonB-linked outer membrane protein [Muribaculaceae bacterium]|nr:SusC/RagA family TonB-linked outer membrane protein [Muribaculaceae bacterium]
MRKLFLILMTLIACTWGLQAQTRTYHGTVLDASDNSPLVGATIMPIGGGQGVAADIDGQFTLTVPSNVKKARVSYVGYTTQDVDLKDGMVVKLSSSASNLDEMIVVAYGTAKKSAYTGSASVVKSDEIENSLVTDVTSAINGKVAGVQMLSSDGAPGTTPSVYIRGTGSLTTSSAPLYVIDGVPMNSGAMLDLSPSDVESMTILKDAAAAALYGARGANGVILVTTKKGKEGKSNITVNANWGASSREIPYYSTISGAAANYQKMYWAIRNYYHLSQNASNAQAHALANAELSGDPNSNVFGYQVFNANGQDLFDSDGNFNPYATLGYVYGNNYLIPDDWRKELLRNGFRQEYNVSASGGGEKYDYMLSFNYLDNQGIIKNSSFQRMTTRFVGNYQLMKWLKVGANMQYSWQKQNYPDGQTEAGYSDNAFYFTDMMAPIYPFYVRNAAGKVLYDDVTGNPLFDFGMRGLGAPNLNRTFSVGNPMGTFVYDVNEYLYDVFDGKWSAIITPVEGLTISGNLGYYVSNARANYMNNNQYGQMAQYGGFVQQQAQHDRTLNVQALANYNKTWRMSTWDFLLGYESYSLQSDGMWGNGSMTYSNSNNTLSNVSSQKDLGGSKTMYATRGIFARVNYDYDSRIFGSVSYRRDASSRFAPGHRWGNFWSLSAAWDIAKESWMQESSDWLNMLKLKASFGQQGNDNIGNYYAYIDQYAMTGVDGVWNTSSLVYKGNPDLTWETSNAFNIGVDFAFLQGKLQGTLEYFSRQTSNMLYNKPVQPSLGYTSFPMNVGSMRNSGVELELNATPVNTKNVQWDLNFNITYQNNKIIKLAPELNGEWVNGSYYWHEGESMYNLYLVQYAGVDEETGMPLYWAKTEDGDEVAMTNFSVAMSGTGDDYYQGIKYKPNRKKTGNLLPPFYGGFGTTLTFFGVDVSVQCGYQFGGKMIDSGYQQLMHNGTSPGRAMHIDVLKAWTETNTNTDVPRLDRFAPYMNPTSDRFLISSKYFSINNISVGYNFPQKWISKCGLSGLRIYGAADNVAIWSARKGLDPRQGFVSSASSSYSAMRLISGGVKLTF